MIFIRNACWWWNIETAFKCSLYRSGSYSHFLRKSFILKTSYLKQFDTLYLTTIRMLDFPFSRKPFFLNYCGYWWIQVSNHPELLTVFIFLSSTLSMSPLHPSLILASLLPNTSVNMLFQNGIKAGKRDVMFNMDHIL